MTIRPTWKIALCLAAIFAAGLAIGSVATVGIIRHKLRQNPADASKVAQAVMKRLQTELSLTPEQVEKVRPAIARASEQIRVFQVEILFRAHRLFVEAEADINPHLDERQKARLQQFVSERREQLRRALGRDVPSMAHPPDAVPTP
jgi:hypothetical protein